MKNEIIIFILILLLYNSHWGKDKDSLYYKESFDYLRNSLILKEKLQNYVIEYNDTIISSVSEEVLSFHPLHFIEEILSYEFPNLSKEEKNNIKGYLKGYENPDVMDYKKYLLKFNETKEFNVLIFFSKRVDNKIVAIATIYDKHYPSQYSYYKKFALHLYFLFYFDEQRKIKNVFHKLMAG